MEKKLEEPVFLRDLMEQSQSCPQPLHSPVKGKYASILRQLGLPLNY